MSGLSYTERAAVLRGEGIERGGIKLYPIKVLDWERYATCKNVLILRQSTLPVSYVSMPYLEALFTMDRDNGFQLGLMARLLNLLAMSTGTEVENMKMLAGKEDREKLESIRCFSPEGEILYEVNKRNFNAVREGIALLNREELPDESENVELVEDQRLIAGKNEPLLDYDFETLLYSVCVQYRIRVQELLGWTIRDFRGIVEAIERDKRFTLCAQAEHSGMIKFEKGNPCPSWQYNRSKDFASGMEKLSDMRNRLMI